MTRGEAASDMNFWKRNCTIMRRFLMPTVLAILALAVLAAPAAASKGWCRSDPAFLIDGKLVDIYVSAPLDAPLKVTGSTKLVVTVPVGVDALFIISDLGFGHGYDVTIAESRSLRKTRTGTEVQVATYVPAWDSTMPVRLEVAAGLLGILKPVSAEGTANRWVVLKAKI